MHTIHPNPEYDKFPNWKRQYNGAYDTKYNGIYLNGNTVTQATYPTVRCAIPDSMRNGNAISVKNLLTVYSDTVTGEASDVAFFLANGKKLYRDGFNSIHFSLYIGSLPCAQIKPTSVGGQEIGIANIDGYDHNISENDDIHIICNYCQIPYKLKFYNNDGTDVFTSRTYAPQTTLELTTPIRDGYTFSGWYTSGGIKALSTEIVHTYKKYATASTNDYTDPTRFFSLDLYAHWEEIRYTGITSLYLNTEFEDANPYICIDNDWKLVDTYVCKNEAWYGTVSTNTIITDTSVKVPIPALSGTYIYDNEKHYTYDKLPHYVTINNLDTDYVDVSGTLSATNAGIYSVHFSLKNKNTKWSDGTKFTKTAEWEIAKINQPLTVTSTALSIYKRHSDSIKISHMSGATITAIPDVQNVTCELSEMSLSETILTVTGTNAGNSVIMITAVESENNLPISVSLNTTILPLNIIPEIPSVTSTHTYSGTEHEPELSEYPVNSLAVTGDTSATNAGNYTMSVTPTDLWEWSDGTSDTKDITWSIEKAVGTLEIDPVSIDIESVKPKGVLYLDTKELTILI